MAVPMDSPEELAMFESFRPVWQGSVANSEASTQESDGSKKQRANNDGQWSRQKRQWQPSKPWYGWEGTAGNAPPTEEEVAKLKACIAQLQRLVLRHEDSINLAKIEVSFVAHFRIDSPNSLVKHLQCRGHVEEVQRARPQERQQAATCHPPAMCLPRASHTPH